MLASRGQLLVHWLWGALTSRTALKVHVAGVTLTMLGTIYEPTLAQTVPQQIDQLGDTLTEVTNNVNLFGAVVVVVVILVIGSLIDRWRERSADARDKAEQKEARIAAAKERADLERRLEQKHNDVMNLARNFTDVAKGAVATHHNANLLGKQIVAQLEADRKSHAAHVDRLIQASDDRYQKFHDEIRTFKEDHLASIEQFGSRITSELSTGLSAMGKEFAQKHKEAMVQVAREQAAMQQNIVNATVAALHEMKLLQPAALEPAKKDTGQLADINISTENVTVNQNEPKGITDAQAIDIYPPSPTHPGPRAADAGADAEAGTDRSGDAGDTAQ